MRWAIRDANGVVSRLFRGAQEDAELQCAPGELVSPADDIDDQLPGWETAAQAGASVVWTGAGYTLEDRRTLLESKYAAKQRLMSAWNAQRSAGVTVGSKLAPSDAAAWTRYLTIKAMAGDGAWVDMPIPLVDGTFEVLTAAKAAALWTALKELERSLLAKLHDKMQALQAATTPEEVQAITWN